MILLGVSQPVVQTAGNLPVETNGFWHFVSHCRQVGLLSLQHCIDLKDTVHLIDGYPDHVIGTAGS